MWITSRYRLFGNSSSVDGLGISCQIVPRARAVECLRKSAAVSWLCNLTPYLLAIGTFRWVSMSRNKPQAHYVRQVLIPQEHSDPSKARLSFSSWARLLCTTACCGMPLENMTKFFWRASEEMECWTSHSQCLHFAVGEWSMETEPCPESCRKCLGNDSILLHLLAVELPAPMLASQGNNRAYVGNWGL